MPVTVTHVAAKAVAYGLAEVPALRSRLARGHVHSRENIDVFVIATADHRYADGMHAAKFADAVRRFLADPAAFAELTG